MPWLLLFRIILSVAEEDAEVAKILELVSKGSTLLKQISNPAQLLLTISKSKILGKGEKQKELTEFQQGLSKLVNTVQIKKKIMSHVTNLNISKLSNIQQKFLAGQKFSNPVNETKINDLTEQDYDNLIGVYVNLSSSALLGGLWIPILQQQSGTYGISTLTYISNPSKSYDYFNVSRETWVDMVKATGAYGTGANSVFIRQYLHGGMAKKQRESLIRSNVRRLNTKVTKQPASVLGVVNVEKAKEGYSKYAKYGLKKKK